MASAGVAIAAVASLGTGCGLSVVEAAPAGAATAGNAQAATNPLSALETQVAEELFNLEFFVGDVLGYCFPTPAPPYCPL
jgi:hypothetical protein